MKDLVAKVKDKRPPRLQHMLPDAVQLMLDTGATHHDIAQRYNVTEPEVGMYIAKLKLYPFKKLDTPVIRMSMFLNGRSEWDNRIVRVITKRGTKPYLVIPVEYAPETVYKLLAALQSVAVEKRGLPDCVLRMIKELEALKDE